MPDQHARSGKAHDLAHLLAQGRLVAVDRAAGAGGLIRMVGAAVDALGGVGEQCLAFRAQGGRAMMCAAVELEHGMDGAFFAVQAALAQSFDNP